MRPEIRLTDEGTRRPGAAAAAGARGRAARRRRDRRHDPVRGRRGRRRSDRPTTRSCFAADGGGAIAPRPGPWPARWRRAIAATTRSGFAAVGGGSDRRHDPIGLPRLPAAAQSAPRSSTGVARTARQTGGRAALQRLAVASDLLPRLVDPRRDLVHDRWAGGLEVRSTTEAPTRRLFKAS